MQKLLIFIITVLIAGNVYSDSDAALNQRLQRMDLGTPKNKTKAPNIILTDVSSGKQVSLRSYEGKIVFLNFWATWCPPCREEMPSMDNLYNKMKGKDFVMLAVSYEEKETLKAFQDEYDYSFPLYRSSDGEAKYGIQSIPATFIIGKDGYIIARRVGAYYWDDEDAIKLFTDLALRKLPEKN